MENNKEILQELKELNPSLLNIDRKIDYKLPPFYFDHLAEEIMEKLKTTTETVSFTKENPYRTPTGYFENLAAGVLQRVTTEHRNNEVFEELETVAPFLNTINKKTVYTVPSNYFDDLKWNGTLVEKTGKAKVVGLSRTALTYAAAAIIIGLLAIGIFLFTGKQNISSQSGDTKAFSEVKNLSEQDIIGFLKTTLPAENIAINNSKKDNDIKSSVREMSDKEIQRFLEENGEQDEM